MLFFHTKLYLSVYVLVGLHHCAHRPKLNYEIEKRAINNSYFNN